MLKRRLARISAVLALAASVVAGTGTSSQAAACPYAPGHTVPKQGSITNNGTVAFGVVHLLDGKCGHEEYDAILYPGEDTYHDLGWSEASAVYIGPTYTVTLSKPGTSPVTWGPRNYEFWVIEPYNYGGNWSVRVYK